MNGGAAGLRRGWLIGEGEVAGAVADIDSGAVHFHFQVVPLSVPRAMRGVVADGVADFGIVDGGTDRTLQVIRICVSLAPGAGGDW